MRYGSCYGAATKFIWLIALMSKTKEEVALALLTIFSVIAPPRILQSDQGGECFAVLAALLRLGNVVFDLSESASGDGSMISDDGALRRAADTLGIGFLPGCIEIHGRSYHSQSQGVHGLCGSHKWASM